MGAVHEPVPPVRPEGARGTGGARRPVADRAEGPPLHVAFAIDNLEASGGTELNALRTAEQLVARGVRLTVVSMRADGPARARYERAGVRVVPFVPGGSVVSGAARAQAARLAEFLRSERVDVVHCHDRYSNVFAGLGARLAARGADRPGLITSKRWTVGVLRNRLLNGIAYRASERVLVNSTTVGHTLTGVEWTPRSRVIVVPNFLDDSAFVVPPPAEVAALRAAWGVPAGAPLVGIVAVLRPEKDHASLMRAFARVAADRSDVRLAVVGGGECEDELRALVAALGIADRVHFVGHVVAAPRAQHALDVSVLSSLTEGFPNSLLEAMAASRPTIATDVGGVRDAIVDGETGWLVPPGRPDTLAAAIARALDAPADAARVGAAGRALVERRHRADPVIATLLRTYQALARRTVGAIAA